MLDPLLGYNAPCTENCIGNWLRHAVSIVLVIVMASSSCMSDKELRGQAREMLDNVYMLEILDLEEKKQFQYLKCNVAEAASDTGVSTSLVKHIAAEVQQVTAQSTLQFCTLTGKNQLEETEFK